MGVVPSETGPREGVLFVAGLSFAALLGLELLLTLALLPHAADGLSAGVALEFVTGREAAFPVALAAGAPPYLVALASVFQNLAVAALILPLVARLLRRWRQQDHFLARRLRRLEDSAARHEAFVVKWGPAGLFAFMLVPLLPNGALVSAVLSRLCGIPVRHVVAPIVGATMIVSFAWAFALDALLSWSGGIDDRVPLLLAILLAGSIIVWSMIGEWRERNALRRA